MANINLLPWRDKQKINQNRKFKKQLLLIFLGAFLLVILMRQYYMHELNQQQANNAVISQKIQALAPQLAEVNKIKSQNRFLQERVDAANRLIEQQNNSLTVWQSLAQAKPNDLFFMQIKRESSQIILFGKAINAKQVDKFNANLANSSWCGVPMVRSVNHDITPQTNKMHGTASSNSYLVSFEVACQLTTTANQPLSLDTNVYAKKEAELVTTPETQLTETNK